MILEKSLIIAYSTPNYYLADLFVHRLKEINFRMENLHHCKDNSMVAPLHQPTAAFSSFWYDCLIKKLHNLIHVLREKCRKDDDFKFFISSDCDILFIKKNAHEWTNLEAYIDNSPHDIFFMRESTTPNVNCGFFIIKNNSNKTTILEFFEKIYKIMTTIDKKDMPLGEQTLINNYKSEINFGYIPNEYFIWADHVYDPEKSLFHHPVCCLNQQAKLNQIKKIDTLFFPVN